MSKLFSPDEDTLIYAETLKQAVEFYKKEIDENADKLEFKELSLDNTIVHAIEMIGVGGYSEIYASEIINVYEKDGVKAPYIINIEEFLEYVQI